MKQVHLSIPEPCHEDWNQMTPTQQGRHCSACAKQVIDFTTMSDAEVLNYFSNLKNKDVCGRAYPDQLERAITAPKEINRKPFWHWSYAAMLFLFFSKSNNAKAQNGGRIIATPQINTKSILDGIKGSTTAIRAGGVQSNFSIVLNGKVIDSLGDPIAFASIKIEGSKTGVSADAMGAFSIRLNPHQNKIVISSVGFYATKFSPTDLNNQAFTLQRDTLTLIEGEIIATAGMVSYERMPAENPKHVAVLKIKDSASLKPLKSASLIIKKKGQDKNEFEITDWNGVYKLKAIRNYDTYTVIASAEGYESKEITIKGRDFDERKMSKEILMTKKETMPDRKDAIIRLGGVSSTVSNKPILYIIDGVVVQNGNVDKLKPNDIEKIDVINRTDAVALYGSAASEGAIVITTKKELAKAVYKILDTVAIKSPFQIKRTCTLMTGQMIADVTVKRTSTDIIKTITTKISNALKISPNPVQKGNTINCSFKLKDNGAYIIQVITASGTMLLQQQIFAPAKEYTQQLQTNSAWSSGVYYIRLLDTNNKLISTNSFVIQ